MPGKTVLSLILLSATGAASTPAFQLGVDYSEWLPFTPTQVATDSSGALYSLWNCSFASPSSCITKLSADGTTVLWQNTLGFLASTMAVDPNGGVYVAPEIQFGDTSIYVAKLSADGTGIAWKTPVGFISPIDWQPALAADSQGRAYVAAPNTANGVGAVVRLNAAGSAVDYTAQLNGTPTAIAVDGSGAAYVAGSVLGGGFVARLAPDGSAGFYSTLPEAPVSVALDANGNATVFEAGPLQRLDSAGNVTVSTNTALGGASTFALDPAGNAYVLGSIAQLYPVSNSLATCGWNVPASLSVPQMAEVLVVIAPDGSVLQSTYVPGSTGVLTSGNFIATGPNSTVFVMASPASGFAPTQPGPFSTTGGYLLLRLSPNTNAETVPLACVGNAATYSTGQIAPGEMVTLIGNGLGPQQGIAPSATFQSPLPTQAGDVHVTFDGIPAPLMWAQSNQINAVVPWSLTVGQTTQICVTWNGVKSNCLSWPVAQTAPGVFTLDGVHAAAINQDGTPNSATNPAAPGSIVSIFATGLGPINPPQQDGSLVQLPLPSNVLPVGVEAEYVIPGAEIPGAGEGIISFAVTYAGPAPYLVAGMSQINFQIAPYNTYGGSIYLNQPSPQSQAFQVYVAGQ